MGRGDQVEKDPGPWHSAEPAARDWNDVFVALARVEILAIEIKKQMNRIEAQMRAAKRRSKQKR
jgi:hypothetical protein